MEIKYSPSVNIIRDEHTELNYTVTPNANKTVNQISDLFNKGFHAFNIIGNYGTGKSSFLWAFEKSLRGATDLFDLRNISASRVDIVNVVGEYNSLKGISKNHFYCVH